MEKVTKEQFDKDFEDWRETEGGWPSRSECADWCFEYFKNRRPI